MYKNVKIEEISSGYKMSLKKYGVEWIQFVSSSKKDELQDIAQEFEAYVEKKGLKLSHEE